MKCKYYLIDAFTSECYQGAQIAVVTGADKLDGPQMQLIAAELSVAETVFILAAPAADAAWQLRIFSPQQELAFAGHPIIAAGFELARKALIPAGPSAIMLQQETIEISVHCSDDDSVRIGFSLRAAMGFDDFVPPARELAELLRLEEQDIEQDNYRPMIASSGSGYLMVPVKSCAALEKARFDQAKWTVSFVAPLASQILIFAPGPQAGLVDFKVRLLGKGIGRHEDPPVGSAVPAFAAYLFADRQDGEHRTVLQRGGGDRRRSILHAQVHKTHGQIDRVTVSGDAVLVGEGDIRVP